jgi:quinolinate synthase
MTNATIAERMTRAQTRLADRIPAAEWAMLAPLIEEIEELKRARNAIVIAHNYMTPDIYHSVADIVGDSLGMARDGAATDAEVIVLAGVHFMAETAKILSPEKTVLIPDLAAGCSLASSITADDILGLKRAFPGVPVVTYVNTTAAVKAVSDICCTSANVVSVVESLGVPRVLLLPDRFLARNVALQTNVEILTWAPGACEVHERFTAADMQEIRRDHGSDIAILAHPECPTDVTAEADFVGSTTAMAKYIGSSGRKKIALITECSMADNLAVEFPTVEWIRPCNMCPHMKRITLGNIRDALMHNQYEVDVPEATRVAAKRALDGMLALGRVEMAPKATP